MRMAAIVFAWAALVCATAAPSHAVACEDVCAVDAAVIIPAGYADQAETRVAEILRERIQRRSELPIAIEDAPNGAALRIYIGRVGGSQGFDEARRGAGIELPGNKRPYEEGFAIQSACAPDGGHDVHIWAADKRALLYGAGELLRRIVYEADSIRIGNFEVSTAPAYRIRGASANQGGTMRQVTGARAWTSGEWQDYVIETALAGTNMHYAAGSDFDFVKSLDLLAVRTGCRPNQLPDRAYPPEWQATEMGRYVCPSIPEAREALFDYWDTELRRRRPHDVLRFYAGDPGGCRCDDCAPWGKTFVELSEAFAAIWLEANPESSVQIVNQDVDNAGDRAIFDYLQEEPREWLDAISYGPGSNAMSEYFRPELREDLFEYPRHGPINRYLAEILNEIPARHDIVHYSDITHWISAQYEVDHPEPNIFNVYGRRTFHARPQAFYNVFQQIMPFSEGDIIYSEGYHDEFHQFLWQRLLWDPHQSLDDVLMDYCTYHFGPDAAPLMARALRILEKNLETPLAHNEGVNEYYMLVREAGWLIPEHYIEQDHRWHLHMQKAALDKYVQLRLLREKARSSTIYRLLEDGLERGEEGEAVAAAQDALAEPIENSEMRRLLAEAGELGDVTEERFAVRNVGYFNLDRPLTEMPWLERELEEAAQADGDQRREQIERIVYYDVVGPGEFYDDAGNPDRQPRLVRGSTFNARPFMDPTNRPSQNTIAYTLMEPEGVAFHYTGLESDVSYRVRMTMVAPRLPQTMTAGAPELRLAQHVLADGEYIARDVEFPEYTAEHFEFDIPAEATTDGEVTIALEPVDGGIATVVSEVWLLRE